MVFAPFITKITRCFFENSLAFSNLSKSSVHTPINLSNSLGCGVKTVISGNNFNNSSFLAKILMPSASITSGVLLVFKKSSKA